MGIARKCHNETLSVPCIDWGRRSIRSEKVQRCYKLHTQKKVRKVRSKDIRSEKECKFRKKWKWR